MNPSRQIFLRFLNAFVLVAFVLTLGVRPRSAWSSEVAPHPVTIRFGDHPGFGRIVFDSDDFAQLPVDQVGRQISVALGRSAHFDRGATPHNVDAMRNTSNAVVFEIAPGATVRHSLINGHLVIDVFDPVRATQKSVFDMAGEKPNAIRNPLAATGRRLGSRHGWVASVPERHGLDPDQAHTADPADISKTIRPTDLLTDKAQGNANPGSKPTTVPSPDATYISPELVALPADVPQAGPGHRLSVPFGVHVGAAAFRLGDDAIVVFDERRPIDLTVMRLDPIFGHASVQLLQAATVLRVGLRAPAELRLEHKGNNWEITAIGGDALPSPAYPIQPVFLDGRLGLPAHAPGMVVSLLDPSTGGVLFVGTQREPGEGVPIRRTSPDFVLLPTWQGVVGEALSDSIVLRVNTSGFEVGPDTEGHPLSISPTAMQTNTASAASRMSRSLDLPAISTPALLRRMQGAIVAASATPSQSRANARRHVAETMLALGLGVEAQAVLGLNAQDDARTSEDPAATALALPASILAGRGYASPGDNFSGFSVDGSDEAALWRAIGVASVHEGSTEAAERFATTLPLLLDYPEPLRQKLLPLVAETMVLGGQAPAAQTLVDMRKDDKSLDLARAMLLDMSSRTGHEDPNAALSIYDSLAGSSDQFVSFRSAVRAAELRLASGLATPAQTAATLGGLLFAWRGDDREIDLRLRVADLLAESGQWRPALRMLRETEVGWPARSAPVHAKLVATLARAVADTTEFGLKPFDLVAMVEENADILPDGDDGQRLVDRVCDQLMALDLPGRAIPFLERMVASSRPGVARAAVGGRLAAARLLDGNPDAAVVALTSTVNNTLPPGLLESRTVSFAKAVAQLGDFASAKRALTELNTQAGDKTLSDLAESAKNWPEAVIALRRYIDLAVPRTGGLDETQSRIVLRLASAAAQAGDLVTLATVRAQQLPQMPPGKTKDLCDLLTAAPVHSVSDLPRVTQDLMLAQAIPGALSAPASR